MNSLGAPPRSASLGGKHVAHHIEIAAPPDRIWALLSDIDGWHSWNPLYIEAKGALSVGETIALTVDLPGMKPQHANAAVIAVEPSSLLQFRGIMMGGLLRGTRYIEIVETAPGRCTVYNGEAMAGLIGPVMARAFGKAVQQGLARMGEALKQAAEQRAEKAA